MIRSTRDVCHIAAFACVLMLPGYAAHADLVASDFNSGGTSVGFTNNWVGSNNVFIRETNDLVYAKYSITQTGTTERVYASNAGPDRQDNRDIAVAMSGEMWFSALVHVPSNSNYAGLSFNNYGFTYDPITTEARILMTPDHLEVGFNGESASSGAGTYAADTTHLLLGQMIIVTGDDTLRVWVDLDLSVPMAPGGLPAPDYSTNAVDFTDSIVNLGVPGSKGAGGDVAVDMVMLSDTATAFYDVTGAEPPPNGMVLLIR